MLDFDPNLSHPRESKRFSSHRGELEVLNVLNRTAKSSSNFYREDVTLRACVKHANANFNAPWAKQVELQLWRSDNPLVSNKRAVIHCIRRIGVENDSFRLGRLI